MASVSGHTCDRDLILNSSCLVSIFSFVVDFHFKHMPKKQNKIVLEKINTEFYQKMCKRLHTNDAETVKRLDVNVAVDLECDDLKGDYSDFDENVLMNTNDISGNGSTMQ